MEILVSPGAIMPRVCDECPQEGPCTTYCGLCVDVCPSKWCVAYSEPCEGLCYIRVGQ